MADSYAQNDEPLYDQAPGQYLHVTPDETVPAQFDNPMYFETKSDQAAGDGNYLAVQEDWLSEQWDLLSAQPWFRGFMSRDDACDELQGKPPGTFVVRVSQSEMGHYAISAIQHKGMDHMLILPSYAGPDSSAPGCTRYRLGTYSRELFNTVPKLIAYYIDHEYIDVRRLQGHVVPETQAGGYMDVTPRAASWNQGEISREDAEKQLRGQPPGAFILRQKRGAGYVLSMAVPAPKNFMHHLVTIEDGSYMIDGVPVGAFDSPHELIDVLKEDTLSCILSPLVDVFGDLDGGAAGGGGGWGGDSEPQYDTAGEAMARAGAAQALYDAVPSETGSMDPTYDEARVDDQGYLGVEPAEPGAGGYPGAVGAGAAGDDPLYSEEAMGGQVDPLADDYDTGDGVYDTARDAMGGEVDEDL